MLKYILLGLLNYQPTTGYDLKRLIDHSTAHFWHAYHSQIYTTLSRMEHEGLLTSEVDAADARFNRRVYTITEAGRAALREWLHQPLTTLTPVKDELLVRLFFSGQRDADDILDELRIQRRLHQQKLEEYRQICPEAYAAAISEHTGQDFSRDGLMWRITLDNGLAFEKMYLAWLDEVIARIEAHY